MNMFRERGRFPAPPKKTVEHQTPEKDPVDLAVETILSGPTQWMKRLQTIIDATNSRPDEKAAAEKSLEQAKAVNALNETLVGMVLEEMDDPARQTAVMRELSGMAARAKTEQFNRAALSVFARRVVDMLGTFGARAVMLGDHDYSAARGKKVPPAILPFLSSNAQCAQTDKRFAETVVRQQGAFDAAYPPMSDRSALEKGAYAAYECNVDVLLDDMELGTLNLVYNMHQRIVELGGSTTSYALADMKNWIEKKTAYAYDETSGEFIEKESAQAA